MRILIAGAAGVLGSHMTDRMLAEGHEVVGVDNLSSSDGSNLRHITSDNFYFMKHDICKLEFGLNWSFDQVYNFACIASPPLYQANPIQTMMTSILGTKNLLDIATKDKARFFQASTSEVYGDPEIHPQNESYRGNVSTIGPRACYDEGKRAAETLCLDYWRMYGTQVRIARIFNTYSSRNNFNDGRVVPNFIKQVLLNEDITIYGDGSQTRSLCHWEDAIEAYIRLMSINNVSTPLPVNIGSEQEITVYQLAHLIIKLANSKSKIIYKDLPIDDPCRRKPDISLAKNILHWHPVVSLIEGLDRTIEEYRTQLGL